MKQEEHVCELRYHQHDVLKQMIDSGMFIQLRRKWHRFIMISRKHPLTQIHYRSKDLRGREEVRHLLTHKYIVSPFSMFWLYWELYMFFVYIFSFIVQGIYAAFFHKDAVGVVSELRLICDILCLLDVIKNFFTGYYDAEHNITVLKPKYIALRYLKFYFWIDVLSSLTPITWSLKRFHPESATVDMIFSTTIFLGLTRIFRLPRWSYSMEMFRQYLNFSSYLFKAMKSFVAYIILMFLWYTFIISTEDNMTSYILNEQTKNTTARRYFTITLVLLLVGLGRRDAPVRVQDIILCTIFYCVAYCMQLYLFAQILQVWNKFASAKNRRQNLFRQLQQYMQYKCLPPRLRERILVYFNFKFQNEFFNEAQINRMVSEELKEEIQLHVTKYHIQRVEFFKGMPEEILIKVAARLGHEIFLPDDIIVQAGSTGNCMYFIYYGTVAVYTHTGQEICHLQDGSNFGEIALVYNETRIASVVAVTVCELFKLKRSDLFQILEPFPELQNEIIRIAHERLVNAKSIVKPLH